MYGSPNPLNYPGARFALISDLIFPDNVYRFEVRSIELKEEELCDINVDIVGYTDYSSSFKSLIPNYSFTIINCLFLFFIFECIE